MPWAIQEPLKRLAAGLRLGGAAMFMAVATAGCSMARLGYDWLPTWLTWQVDRYVDLDSDQKALVNRHMPELYRWHRQTQLKEYAAWLAEVDDRIRTPVDIGQFRLWRDKVGDAWTPLADRLARPMAELLLTLRPEQVERIRGRLEKANQELRENYFPARRSREEARADRVVKRAEFFLGALTDEQERHLRAKAAQMPPSEDVWLEERAARQKAFLELAQKVFDDKPSLTATTRLCRDFLRHLWSPRDAERKARLDRMSGASDALTLEMLNGANALQRAHLSSKLRGFVDDFRALAQTQPTGAD